MLKRKASFTIALILVILPIMAFFLLLLDFLRISQAKQKLEMTTYKAMEAALVEYDEDIYEKYKLMVIRDEMRARSIFERAMIFTSDEGGGRPNLSSYKLEKVNLTLGAPLSDIKALKMDIIKRHEKYFIVSSLEKWMKKLDELKKLKPYAKACEAYSEALSEILKLKKDYDKLGLCYQKIENLYQEVRELNIYNCLEEIKKIEEEVKELKFQLRELKNELRGFQSNLEIKDIGENKDMSLKEEIEKLEAEIGDKEEDVKSKREKIDQLLEKNKEGTLLYDGLRAFLTKLEGASDKIRQREEEIINLEGEANIEDAKELIRNLSAKVEAAMESLRMIKPDLEIDVKKGEEQSKFIRKALNQNLSYEGRNDIKDLSYADLASYEALSSLFGSFGKREGEVNISGIMDIIWMALNGELLPDFKDLDYPDFSKAPHLPSKDKSLIKKHKLSDFLERYNEDRPSKEDFGTKALEKSVKSTKEIASKELSFEMKAMFEKLVIADYIIDTFRHYSFQDNDKKHFFSGAEVEYILSGSEDTKHNLVMTQLKIFALRYCLNFVPIALYKTEDIDKISLFLSSFTGGLGYPIYKGIVTMAWVSIETMADLKEINEGRGSVIIKSREDIICSISPDDFAKNQKEILDRELKNIRGKDGGEEQGEEDGRLRMNYEDHLFLFLVLENQDESLIRIADLIALKEKLDTRTLFSGAMAEINYDIGLFFPGARKYFKLEGGLNLKHDFKTLSTY